MSIRPVLVGEGRKVGDSVRHFRLFAAALLTALLALSAAAAPARADHFTWHNFIQIWWDFDVVYSDLVTVRDNGQVVVYEGGPMYWENQALNGGHMPTDADALLMPGDWNGDGHADYLYRTQDGILHAVAEGSSTTYLGHIGWGWHVMTALTSPGDWDGDGSPDVLARDGAGILWMYRGDGVGGWLPGRVQVGWEWNEMTAIFSGHDFNGDGPSDVLARDANGNLWLYPGNGFGGWKARILIGWGWEVMDLIAAPGDFTYDGFTPNNWNKGYHGKGDVIARDRSGTMWLYTGNGTGGFTGERRVLNIPTPKLFG